MINRSHRFESHWGLLCCYLGQVIYTYVLLSPSSIFGTDYQPNSWEINTHHAIHCSLALCPWSHSVSLCLAEDYRNGGQCHPVFHVAQEGLYFVYGFGN